ncbi:MAG: putative motility protein [Planctomycetes bacterium]|nr:putative motility protein [Planctomycetota bacterium]
MSVEALGSGLSLSIANLSTAQAAQNVEMAAGVAVLKKTQDAQANAILSLLSQALGVGQNLDVLA